MIRNLNGYCWQGSYIFFRDIGTTKSGKTIIWEVTPDIWESDSDEHADPLGVVKWFGQWRKYSFFPAAGTLYEETCLREIAEFCETITKEHKDKKKVAKLEAE